MVKRMVVAVCVVCAMWWYNTRGRQAGVAGRKAGMVVVAAAGSPRRCVRAGRRGGRQAR